jgi:two-component system, OmpR family, KDP operon response regulator KdpE
MKQIKKDIDMEGAHILVVDDDPAILKLLNANLKARDYRVSMAMDGEEALDKVGRERPNLVILDIMIPKLDGVEVCRRIREWSPVPIIMLSAKGDEKNKVLCLELGANDYLTKPFGVAELTARIKTALRHSDTLKDSSTQPILVYGDLEINFTLRRVTVRGTEVRLTKTEYSLLQQLAINAGKVLTNSTLLQNVWGSQYYSEKEYLRVFIRRLRKRLEPNPDHPMYILTSPGVGYHFVSLH